jgi:hypothetical protein
MIPAIIDCLKEQNNLMTQILAVSYQQIDAIKINDLEQITSTTAKQNDLGRKLALKEKERRELAGSKILSELIDIANPTEQQTLQELSEQIRANQIELQDQNELIRMLLKPSLQYINKLLGCFNSSEETTYGATGKVKQHQLNTLNCSV